MPKFGTASLASREKLHPILRQVVDAAIEVIDFRILDSTRGRADQERAFATGKSKARFGQSAHNYVPAIAVDLFPAPYDWNNRDSFTALSKVILAMPAKLGLRDSLGRPVVLRWGGDWNMDGAKTTSDGWDMPHYELHEWRAWAKSSKLYEG